MPTSSLAAVVIADDLTGALEMGALLASRRLRTIVTTDSTHLPDDAGAVVIDTETRNLPAEEAAQKIRIAAEALTSADCSAPLFKKVDSTLRGPIGAELRALSSAFGDCSILLSPAYPQMGRLVRHGRLLVNGVEVSRTEFARDPRWPVVDSNVKSLLGDDVQSERIRVCDAESEDDLQCIVANAPAGAILAGSGGLGRAWVDTLPQGSNPEQIIVPPRFPLLVCGSRHPASVEQAQRAADSGINVIVPPNGLGDPNAVVRTIAEEAYDAITTLQPDLLVLFGGETAAALLARTGIRRLYPIKELFTGTVLSLASRGDREIMIVTKAGGFGERDIMERILRQMR